MMHVLVSLSVPTGDTNKTLSKFERALIWPFLTLWGESFKDQQLG